ncbi:MAG: protein kinase, partial [Thermoanaerobaculia bacterium]
MPLTAGSRLGPYEILSPLGAGGMGEVYRAHDGKLNREVAIKVLPDAVARDPERLARFRREAQVLASLNHPHIAAIYGLEESGGLEALVLELVEGETLAERIARGRIPLDESLEIARQIARALEAAHERGIVHRDLKPANVKLTPEGQVKVLDFGLAKALSGSGSSPDVTSSPTMTAAATQAGVVIGTAAYMSPEQARGKAVDKRADIWAFGTVVYEMLAGRKTFEGETVSDMLAAVLTKDPDWSALPPGTPPSVRRVLRRCLDRDAKTRFHDIADARLELDEAPERGPVPASTVAATARRSPLLLSGVIYAAVAADGTFAFVPGTDSAVERSIVLVDRTGKAKALAAPLRSYHYPRFSPDGKRLAVSIGPGHGNADDVWVYDIESGALTRLTFGDENGNYYAVWSHDGRRVAYSSDRAHQGIHLKNADGSGEEEPLQPNPRPDLPSDWSRDGTMLAITRDFPTTHIFTVSLPERKEVPFAANA